MNLSKLNKDIELSLDLINLHGVLIQHENIVSSMRDVVYRESISFGEDLMPCEVANIMLKYNSKGKYKGVLEYAFTSKYGKVLMLHEIYRSCDFYYSGSLDDIDLFE